MTEALSARAGVPVTVDWHCRLDRAPVVVDRTRRCGWIRRATLRARGEAVLEACSLFPAPRTGGLSSSRRLAHSPGALGARLFEDRRIVHGPLEIRRCGDLWLRRRQHRVRADGREAAFTFVVLELLLPQHGADAG